MPAWQYASPGAIEATLKLIPNTPKPTTPIAADSILLQVTACGLNPADYKVQELGLIARAITAFPKTPGLDMSGKVISVGDAVSHIKVGAYVVGRIDPFKAPGALSHYLVVPAKNVAVLPEGVDVVQAAGFPTGVLTAYQTIAPHVTAGSGEKIFINGGTGGTGIFGIQIAKILGCHVTVTCSTNKVELCRELGADEVIDYKTSNVTELLRKKGHIFSLIVDNVGNSPSDLFSSSRSYLGASRPYVFVGGNMSFSAVTNLIWSLVVPAFLGGVKGKFVTFMTKDDQEHLELLTKWLGEGKVKIIVDSTVGFDDAKGAMQHLKAGSITGKVIVTTGLA